MSVQPIKDPPPLETPSTPATVPTPVKMPAGEVPEQVTPPTPTSTPPDADQDQSRVASDESAATDLAEKVAHIALSMLGTPYRRGGHSATGLDCSGLIHYSYALLQRQVPRDTLGLRGVSRVVPMDELRVGDLLFFHILRRPYSHVGLYLGDGRFVHAPATGGHVRVEKLSNSYWRKRFAEGRRMPTASP